MLVMPAASDTVARRMRYFEDIEVGTERETPLSDPITADEIKAFAGEFDPMPFHLDEEAARASPMGGLCASSIHTIAIGTKLTSRATLGEEPLAVLGGLGWNDIRFPAPLLAGNRVRVKLHCEGKRLSQSRPGTGIMTNRIDIHREDGTLVATYRLSTLVACRPADARG